MYIHTENHYSIPQNINLLSIESALESFQFTPTNSYRTVDHYFDTFSGELYFGGSLLRIRKEKNIQFKGPIEKDLSRVDERAFKDWESDSFREAMDFIKSPELNSELHPFLNHSAEIQKVATITTIRHHYVLSLKEGTTLPISIMLHNYGVENNSGQKRFNAILEVKPLAQYIQRKRHFEKTMVWMDTILKSLNIHQSKLSKYHQLDSQFLFGE